MKTNRFHPIGAALVAILAAPLAVALVLWLALLLVALLVICWPALPVLAFFATAEPTRKILGTMTAEPSEHGA